MINILICDDDTKIIKQVNILESSSICSYEISSFDLMSIAFLNA